MRTRYLVGFGLALAGFATIAGANDEMVKLRGEPKFAPTRTYTGPDSPTDARKLVKLINVAIDDVKALNVPADASEVRRRLIRLIEDVDQFATEDRDAMYRYVVRLWRAAGFAEESRLFPVPDDRVIGTR